jgi:hypothetical protein
VIWATAPPDDWVWSTMAFCEVPIWVMVEELPSAKAALAKRSAAVETEPKMILFMSAFLVLRHLPMRRLLLNNALVTDA